MLESNVSSQQLHFLNNSKNYKIMCKNYDLMISCKSNTISSYLILIKTCSDNSIYLTVINVTNGHIVRSAEKIEYAPIIRACYDFLAAASEDNFDIVNSGKDLLYQAYIELIAHLVFSSILNATLAFDSINLTDLRFLD